MATNNIASLVSGGHTWILVDNASQKTYDNYATDARFTISRDGTVLGQKHRSLRQAMKTYAHVVEKANIVAGIGGQARRSPGPTNTA